MKLFTKILALVLAVLTLVSLVACNNTTPTDPSSKDPSNNVKPTNPDDPSKRRTITIGVHWEWHYDSNDDDPTDDPAYAGTVQDQMRYEVVDYIEKTYNVNIEFVDLTWDGVRESINTSVLAGTPECDLYLVDPAAGISAVTNGLALDLKTVLPADADILSDQKIMSYLDLGDGKASLMYSVKAENQVADTYPLAFNKQLLEEANLEDPRELYARGEWTWDKFVEYCRKLTKDTDGDGEPDQYGFDGFIDDYLPGLLMSNGATIAATDKETLSSAATGQVLDFIYKLYNEYKVAKPVDPSQDGWYDLGRTDYRKGNIGFWVSAAWMTGTDYDWDGSVGTTLNFDTVYVQWPVGPSGNKDTNGGKMVGGGTASYFIIPYGVEDPELVYNVWEAYNNWYMGDTSIRDDKEALWWWYAVTAKNPDLQEENFAIMKELGSKENYDLYGALGLEWQLPELLTGTMTAAQFQETYRQEVQNKLDEMLG